MIITRKEQDYLINLFNDLEDYIDNDIRHCEDGAESLRDKLFPELGNYKFKRITNKILADYLGVSEQAVKQYPKEKANLMKLGLYLIYNEK